jgi:hypothetical protein
MTSDHNSYRQGYVDGRRHALNGRPALCSPTPYGQGFYDGWKSVRYPDEQNRGDARVDPAAPATRTA